MKDLELTPAENGHAITGDAAIIAAIEQQCAGLRARHEQLKAELAKVGPDLRRYEKAIAAIRGESLGTSAPAKPARARNRTHPTTNQPALERTWKAIQQLTETADDFTQVQVRAITNDPSGVSSVAFEALRQEGKIRFARQDGNQKVYRLTNAIVAEQS